MKIGWFEIIVFIALIGNIISLAYQKQFLGMMGWVVALLYFIAYKGVSS